MQTLKQIRREIAEEMAAENAIIAREVLALKYELNPGFDPCAEDMAEYASEITAEEAARSEKALAVFVASLSPLPSDRYAEASF